VFAAALPHDLRVRDPRWLRAARWARLLSWVSLAWMTGEGILGLVAGLDAGSVSLLGWAAGSVIEGLASIIVIWRFTGARTLSETAEARAQRAVAASFSCSRRTWSCNPSTTWPPGTPPRPPSWASWSPPPAWS
jgi:hypothetical protein